MLGASDKYSCLTFFLLSDPNIAVDGVAPGIFLNLQIRAKKIMNILSSLLFQSLTI